MDVVPATAGLSSTALRVLAALRAQSSLGASILKTQCELARLSPARLTEEDLPVLIPLLVVALGRFVQPGKVELFAASFSRWSQGSQIRNAETAVCEALQGKAPVAGLANGLLEILTPLVPLSVPMLKAQCVKTNVDFANITRSDLPRLVTALVAAVERFTSPEKSQLTRKRLDEWMVAQGLEGIGR